MEKLRVQVREDLDAKRPKSKIQVLVVDSKDNVLGCLEHSVQDGGITYKPFAGGRTGILTLELATQRGNVDTIEVEGYNAPVRKRPRRTAWEAWQ